MVRRSAITVTFDAFHAVATRDAFIIITRRRGIITLPFCSTILIISFGIDAFAVADDLRVEAGNNASSIFAGITVFTRYTSETGAHDRIAITPSASTAIDVVGRRIDAYTITQDLHARACDMARAARTDIAAGARDP